MRKQAALLLALLALLPFAYAAPVTVTVQLLNSDGITPISGATVYLYNASGYKFSGVTNSTGMATITVGGTGLHLVEVKNGYVWVTTINVTSTSTTFKLTKPTSYANVTSVPVQVTFNLSLPGTGLPAVEEKANVTIYSTAGISLSFPSAVLKFPFKYAFDHIAVTTPSSTTTVNTTLLSLTASDLANKPAITAYYKQELGFALEPWMVVALAGVVVFVLIAAFVVGTKTTKQAIEELRAATYRFVARSDSPGPSFRFVEKYKYVKREDE